MRNSESQVENVEGEIINDHQSRGTTRTLSGFPRYLAFAIGFSVTCFIFYTAIFGVMLPVIQRSIVLCSLLALTFLWFPANKKANFSKPSIIDWLLITGSIFSLGWTIFNHTRFLERIPFFSEMLLLDKLVAVLLVISILEAGRRTLGLSITIITGFFIAYAFLGPYFPSVLSYKGIGIDKFVDQVYMTTEGMFSSLSGLAATLLFAFVAFGTILQCTGADKLFMNIFIALAGRKAGGPAKIAILSSAAMGSISGSSIANVVTTGTLTIPLMKKTGYTPEEAGAIETAASTGGQIMPPIMGTGAFILAETIGMPYMKVVLVSIIPALLYFAAIYLLVDIKAKKRKLKGLPEAEVPNLHKALRAGGIYFIPLIVLIILLAFNFTPFLSGIGCTILVLLLAQARKSTRVSVKQIALGFENCAKSMVPIAGVIYCACIIVSMINITGLMMKTTAIILSLSGGMLWATVILVAVIAYILGMGLPISTSYVILATLGAPAMVAMGVDLLSAHMSIFWFTQLATITPPVCMTAFAAAAIAKANPMKTGFTALIFGATFYYVPVLFIYSDLINGTILTQCIIGAIALVAIYFLGTFTEGYFITDSNKLVKFGGLAIFILLYVSMFNAISDMLSIVAIALAIITAISMFVIQKRKLRKIQYQGKVSMS